MTSHTTTTHGGPRKGAGRKPTGAPPSSTVSFRLPTSEKAGWVKRAQSAGMKLSDWVRMRCR